MSEIVSMTEETENFLIAETPQQRFIQLQSTFAGMLSVIAKMNEERDWETLKKEDGSSYENLSDLVQDALGKSSAWSNKMIQASQDFYVPIDQMTVEGTVINITSTEASKLGQKGLKQVTERVQENLEAHPEANDAASQTQLINEAKEEVMQEKIQAKEDRNASIDDDSDFEAAYNAEQPFSDEIDEESGYLDDEGPDDDDFNDDDEDFDDGSTPAPKKAKKKEPTGDDGGASTPPPSNVIQPIADIMQGGETYDTDEKIESLPEELQELVRAVNLLSTMDPQAMADLVTYETRGVTYRVRLASGNLRTFHSIVETSPWVLERF